MPRTYGCNGGSPQNKTPNRTIVKEDVVAEFDGTCPIGVLLFSHGQTSSGIIREAVKIIKHNGWGVWLAAARCHAARQHCG